MDGLLINLAILVACGIMIAPEHIWPTYVSVGTPERERRRGPSRGRPRPGADNVIEFSKYRKRPRA